MMLATDWSGDYGLPADVIKSAAPCSGLFEPLLAIPDPAELPG